MVFNMFPQLVDIFQDMALDVKDIGAVSIVYSHLQVTLKKWDFQVADFALFR